MSKICLLPTVYGRFSSFPWLSLCVVLFFFVSSSFSLAQKLASPLSFAARSVFIMDHTQSREFHHHLARAIMHLKCLAGFLPFFEPAIEWDDPMGEPFTRTGRSNPAQRNLHTFVPLPSSSSIPTMASHGGIPTHMILNPEPNLRPFSTSSRPRDEEGHPAIAPTLRNPISDSCPPPAPVPRLPEPHTPRVTTWTTTAVPVRSKQRSNNPDDPQPKKKQRSEDIVVHSSSSQPISLPIIDKVPPEGFNSDDSDEEVVSRVHSVHTTSAVEAGAVAISSTIPADRPISPTPGTSTPITIPKGPPPNRTIRILQPPESDRDTPHSTIRPWTGTEDQELINLKNDSKSRPSWKSIGARLRRDPQICKIRWNLLKQMSDQHGTETPRNEPEAED